MGVQDQLRIGVRRQADRVIVSLEGELDMASAELLEQAIDAVEGDGLVLLDLDRLQFIDSTGLRAVLSALERCRDRGQDFAVTQGSQQVQRLLSVTGVAKHLRVLTPAPQEVLA